MKTIYRFIVVVAFLATLILSLDNMFRMIQWQILENNSKFNDENLNEYDTMTHKKKSKDKYVNTNDGKEHVKHLTVNKAHPGNTIKDEIVDKMIDRLKLYDKNSFFPSEFWKTNFNTLTLNLGRRARENAKILSAYKNIKKKKDSPSWKLFHENIRQFSLYDPEDPSIEILMHEMATLPITAAEIAEGGTEFKLTVTFSNGGEALIKPMRYKREVEANENHYIFDDMERHVAEIAAFQLDKFLTFVNKTSSKPVSYPNQHRLLGFYRVPPTIGRRINITSELKPISPSAVTKTIYTSPAGNLCFYGNCHYYCDHAHAFCGNPDTIEISVQSYLPSEDIADRHSRYQPWRRSYSKHRKAYWETHVDMCDSVRKQPPYNNGKLLLDIIDVHTFDFLTGSKDRHNIAVFKEFGNFSFPILYDNGRGFGRQTYDAMSILAPLRQCCLIRKSTLLKYIKLYTGPELLSSLMEKALASDPVAPVLIRGHLNALDRRLVKVLQAVAVCLEHNATDNVIVSDRF